MSFMVKSTSASRAMASRCSTVFVHTAHGDVERHCILESGEVGDAAQQTEASSCS